MRRRLRIVMWVGVAVLVAWFAWGGLASANYAVKHPAPAGPSVQEWCRTHVATDVCRDAP